MSENHYTIRQHYLDEDGRSQVQEHRGFVGKASALERAEAVARLPFTTVAVLYNTSRGSLPVKRIKGPAFRKRRSH